METVAAYVGVTVLTGAVDTPVNLLSLIRAVDPKCPATCRELNIQYDPSQAGAGGAILIGDSRVATAAMAGGQRCGFSLLVGGSLHYGAGAMASIVNLANIWVVPDTVANLLLNVQVEN